MAKGRSSANLAGLAALGTLGYMLTKGDKKAPFDDRSTTSAYPDESRRGKMASAARADEGDNIDVGGGFIPGGLRINEETSQLYDPSGRSAAPAVRAAAPKVSGEAAAPAASTARAAAPVGEGGSEMARGRGYNRAPTPPVIGPRSTGQGGATAAEMAKYQLEQRAEAQRGRGYNRADTSSNEAMRGRGYNRADAPSTASAASRTAPMTRQERIAQIPTGGPTVKGGERVSGNEFTRNLSNTLNATTGLSAPGFVGKMTQQQYNARAAARRAEEGLSPAEAAAARQRMADAAADGGMKRGGAVKAKKMASGGVTSSASKRADGIASRGKTKCKIY